MMPLVLLRKELIRFWNRKTQCPTVQTHTPHCIQEDQAYNKPVVQDSLYPMISRLLRHAQGQTLAEF